MSPFRGITSEHSRSGSCGRYTAGADADAISITCSHPGPAAILEVYATVCSIPVR